MSFLSFNFAIFAGLALLIFHLAPPRSRPGLLLAFSYIFYASWVPVHTLLLAAVTAAVYGIGLRIEACKGEGGKRAAVSLGIVALLVLLMGFKASFWLLKEFHADPATRILVPIGLSYFAFKMMGYLLDVYWENIPAQRNFAHLALYGSFFPQILSGPIQRAQSFFEQIEIIRNPDSAEFLTGLRRILFGLFKKIAVADTFAAAVANVHGDPSGFSSLELLAGAYFFTLQLYADFSGITDIAIGLGMLFGVKGPENFDLPFYASNIQEFWRRWHMSLTTWLRDYFFTPFWMALRQFGTLGMSVAIFINMVAIGLWHALSLTFLVFGVIHGVYLTVSALTLKRRNTYFEAHATLQPWRNFIAPLVTFHMVVFSLIFFRAESLPSALEFVKGLVPGMQPGGIPHSRFDLALMGITQRALVLGLLGFFATEAVTWAAKKQEWIDWFFATPLPLRRVIYGVLALAVLLLSKDAVTFIYAGF